MSNVENIVARELGAEGLNRLTAAFYARVKTDDLLGPMYPADDWEGSEKRLREFFCFRFLGDPAYMENRGHPRLRMRHFPFVIGAAEADRWVSLMESAMDDCKLVPAVRVALVPFFRQVADFLKNQ